MSKNLSLVLLSIALLFSMYFNYSLHQEVHQLDLSLSTPGYYPPSPSEFRKVMDTALARTFVDHYRTIDYSGNTYGVWYDADTMRYYLTNLYPRIIDTLQAANPIDTTLYQWGVGFYFLNKIDTTDHKMLSRLSFCTIPTLRIKSSGKIVDFFAGKPVLAGARYRLSASKDSIAYDEGQMWP